MVKGQPQVVTVNDPLGKVKKNRSLNSALGQNALL